jgi:DNA-binding beta-propeller fold protein YncE
MKTVLTATMVLIAGFGAYAQSSGPAVRLEPPVPTGPAINSAPNPYRTISGWFKMPEGRTFGSTGGVAIDKRNHVWVAERCGVKGFIAASCADSKLDPVWEFDETGKVLHNFGGGLMVMPHGISVDADGNVWVTDNQGKEGRGHQVFKFSPEGKILMTLGTPGVAGLGPNLLDQPNAVAFAPNGDIFISEGHSAEGGNRIVKLSKDGKFIKAWGKKGSGPGEFDLPHCLVFDSKGRLLVGDRNNNRIQVFDQDGNFIEQFTQFSRPSGIAVDKNDVIYVADSESESVSKNHFGWKRGIRVGSMKDGKITAYIPDPLETSTTTSAAEGIAVDSKGVVYGAEVVPNDLKKYVKR